MAISNNYKYTKLACYIGYINQAIVVNFIPLLFLTFNSDLGVSLEKISLLSGINFAIQFAVDLIAARYADSIGYRKLAILGQMFCALGLIGYGILPFAFSNAYVGLIISASLTAVGGGLIEVLISPIVEACPAESKSGSMSFLHSFYCWGQAGVVLLSTLFFMAFGIDKWRYLSAFWGIIPILNAVLFLRVPIGCISDEKEKSSKKELFSDNLFKVLLLLMITAGASEIAMSQWASAFAESGLGVSKSVGDLAGPCLFAILMGTSRVFYSVFSKKINLISFMTLSGVLCVISYMLAAFSPSPMLGLVGCALCGLSVGILWPGTISIAARICPRGGTFMFGILALCGDIGCTLGTAAVGFISGIFGDSLKIGISAAMMFPILLIISLIICRKSKRFVK